jgi:hypothetical protein
MTIKDIEKKLMEPSKIPLSEIRQLKRELALLRIEERKAKKKQVDKKSGTGYKTR